MSFQFNNTYYNPNDYSSPNFRYHVNLHNECAREYNDKYCKPIYRYPEVHFAVGSNGAYMQHCYHGNNYTVERIGR